MSVNENIRNPNVAGKFYPADAAELKELTDLFLENVDQKKVSGRIKAIMVPHAGYNFSGAVAAYAYKQLEGKKIDNVILISNSHSLFFDNIAIDGNSAWQTPLGQVELNQELAKNLISVGEKITLDNRVHELDHVLEVQLPFLQTVLPAGFKILPILFGAGLGSYLKLAAALEKVLGDNDLILISSDMSHYPAYDHAARIDKQTLDIISSGTAQDLDDYIDEVGDQMVADLDTVLCAADAVKTLLSLKDKIWNKAQIVNYANSGDLPDGNKKKVVGYGSMIFTQDQNKETALTFEEQEQLKDMAKIAVQDYVLKSKVADFAVNSPKLMRPGSAFVTIKNNGQLRGCIGDIAANKPLWQVVRDMAIAAATQDGRFPPIKKNDLKNLSYEISVLSEPQPVSDWQQIELGKHGVIINRDKRSGLFLPQVAQETGWAREEFLQNLCLHKAGLAADSYKDKKTEIYTFTAEVF